MAVITGEKASINISSMPSLSFTDEATTAGPDFKTYAINDQAKRYWDRSVSISVERSTDGIVWNTVSDTEYTVQFVGGKVIFQSAQAPGILIRVDGNYLPYSQLGDAKEWSLEVEAEMADITAFGDGWKNQMTLQRKASATLAKWWLDAFFLDQLDRLLVLVLDVDSSSGKRYEAYARFSKDSVKLAVSGMVEEELTLEMDGELYYVG